MFSHPQRSAFRLFDRFPTYAFRAVRHALSACGVALCLFTASAQAAQVTLAWDEPDSDPAAVGGYELYYWQPSWDEPASVDVGQQTTATLVDLEAGQTYYFAVTVYDSNGENESAFSNEVSTTIPSGNQPPVVTMGADQTIGLGMPAVLEGTVTDDGLPAPPGAVTTTWSLLSRPGTVTFTDPFAIATTASFSESGSYMLILRADDGELDAWEQVTITVTPWEIPGSRNAP